MLTEERTINQITVAADDTILVQEKVIIKRDGLELATSYHRLSFPKGSDVSGQDARVQVIAAAAWA